MSELDQALEALRRCAKAVGATVGPDCSFQFHMYIPGEVELAVGALDTWRQHDAMLKNIYQRVQGRMNAEGWGCPGITYIENCLNRIEDLSTTPARTPTTWADLAHQVLAAACSGSTQETFSAVRIAELLTRPRPLGVYQKATPPLTYNMLRDQAWELYCKDTAGSADCRDHWHELNIQTQLHYLEEAMK